MSNPHKGEVTLKAGAETYSLRFTMNALAELEDATGQSFVDIAEALNTRPPMKLVRAVLWAALLDSLPQATLKQAGEIIDAAGFAAVSEKIGAALLIAFPQEAGGDAAENPPAAAGTGTGR